MPDNQTLVLYTQMNNLYFPDECDECKLVSLYKNSSYIHRVVRKLVLKYKFPGTTILFSHWLKEAATADKIIVFDTGNVADIVSFLRKKYPDKRIIVWYWNSVKAAVHPDKITAKNIEFWSFDEQDCAEYGFNFNTQFFIEGNMKRVKSEQRIKNTVFYVGADKNRASLLAEIAHRFEEFNVDYYYHLVRYKNSTNDNCIEYKQPMLYPEVLTEIQNSTIVMDLVADWQSGLTLRPLEALFYKKKLITNMKQIVNYDLYNPKNIFIIGIDKWGDLPGFIHEPYDSSKDEELIKKYSMRGWLSRFDDISLKRK